MRPSGRQLDQMRNVVLEMDVAKQTAEPTVSKIRTQLARVHAF